MKSLHVGGVTTIASTSRLEIRIAGTSAAHGVATFDKVINLDGILKFDCDSNLGSRGVKDNYQDIYVNGINGSGLVLTSNTAVYEESEDATFIFTNTANATLSGACVGYLSNKGDTKSTINLKMNGTAAQTFSNAANSFNNVDVVQGSLFLAGSAQSVSVTGGKLGVSSDGSIGALSAASLAWTGGTLAFDFDKTSFDALTVAGAFSAANFDALIMEFNLLDTNNVSEGTEYKILEFAFSSITQDQLDAIALDVTTGYKAKLNLGSDYVGVTFTSVPEPAAIAAIFGAIALGMAVYRRRK